jgi:hypothetical protein
MPVSDSSLIITEVREGTERRAHYWHGPPDVNEDHTFSARERSPSMNNAGGIESNNNAAVYITHIFPVLEPLSDTDEAVHSSVRGCLSLSPPRPRWRAKVFWCSLRHFCQFSTTSGGENTVMPQVYHLPNIGTE